MSQARERPTPALAILLVEDHESTRREMCGILEAEADISVVGQSSTAEEGLRKAHALHPSVVVMDLALPGMNGLAATRRLLAEAPESRILILSNHVGPDLVKLALAAGAKGFVRKDRAFEELIPAVRSVQQNTRFLGQGLDEE